RTDRTGAFTGLRCLNLNLLLYLHLRDQRRVGNRQPDEAHDDRDELLHDAILDEERGLSVEEVGGWRLEIGGWRRLLDGLGKKGYLLRRSRRERLRVFR